MDDAHQQQLLLLDDEITAAKRGLETVVLTNPNDADRMRRARERLRRATAFKQAFAAAVSLG